MNEVGGNFIAKLTETTKGNCNFGEKTCWEKVTICYRVKKKKKLRTTEGDAVGAESKVGVWGGFSPNWGGTKKIEQKMNGQRYWRGEPFP